MSARDIISSVERDIFSIAFQKSPLFLKGGIVKSWGNTLLTSVGQFFDPELPEGHPISSNFFLPLSTLISDAIGVAVSDAASALNAIGGHFSLGTDSLDDLLLDWQTSDGSLNASTLFAVTPSTYPLANQTVAANAQISQPLNTYLQMSIVPHTVGHYTALPLAIAAMKQIFQMHSNLGGLYHIVTPGYVWTNMILTQFSDITKKPEEAPASTFQLAFQKPIVTHSGAAQEMSSLVTQFHTGAILP